MAQFEKDYRQLCKQIKSLADGQVRVSLENTFDRPGASPSTSSDSLSSSDTEETTSKLICYIEITPNDGPYARGSFVFAIEASPDGDYPETQPVVSCLTRIYHPNIDTAYGNCYNNVCVSTLNDWDGGPTSTLADLLQGLMFIFQYPNVDDPLTSNVTTDELEFQKNVRISIEGGCIEDFDQDDTFEMNYGYRRFINEQEDHDEEQEEDEQQQQQQEVGEQLDDYLVQLLTRPTNFKEIFDADTLDLLMTAPPVAHPPRHNKEASTNS